MASMEVNLKSAFTRIATEFKSVRSVTGALINLTTTDKTNLVAAVNEVKAATAAAGAQINDATTATTTVWSSTKTNTSINSAVSALVAASPATLDTLDELAAALGDDANFAATTATALGNRVRVDAAQTLTEIQKTQGRTNLGAGTGSSNLVIGTVAGTAADAAAVGDTNADFVATFVAGLV